MLEIVDLNSSGECLLICVLLFCTDELFMCSCAHKCERSVRC